MLILRCLLLAPMRRLIYVLRGFLRDFWFLSDTRDISLAVLVLFLTLQQCRYIQTIFEKLYILKIKKKNIVLLIVFNFKVLLRGS